MKTATKIKLACKYRRLLWRGRKVYRYRRELAIFAVAGAVLAIAVLIPYRAK